VTCGTGESLGDLIDVPRGGIPVTAGALERGELKPNGLDTVDEILLVAAVAGDRPMGALEREP